MERGVVRLRYEPALDGLRAVAVLAVFAYHLDWGWAGGGFLGVDAFFVLSGYLITALLLREWSDSGGISRRGFYVRRARRLLPALFVLLGALAVGWAVAAPSDQLAGLRSDGLASLFYVANWHLVTAGQSYFALFTEPSPLRHLWSLAIEEQFYLVWPLVMVLVLRRGSRRLLAAVCVIGIVASVVAMALLYQPADPLRSYYGTDTRLHEILVGALLALVPADLVHRWAGSRRGRIAGTVAAAASVAALLWVSDRSPAYYRGGSLVFAVLVAVVIATSTVPVGSVIGRALSAGVLVRIGLLSYAIYLWHWPVIVYVNEGRTGLDGLVLDALRIAVTFVLATLSLVIVERPAREQRLARPLRRLLLPAGAVTVAGAILVATAGASEPDRLARAAPAEVLGIAARSRDPDATTVELFGDSIAYSLAPRLRRELGRYGLALGTRAVPACGVVEGIAVDDVEQRPYAWSRTCNRLIPRLQRDTIRSDRPDYVVWLSLWETHDRIIDGRLARLGTPDGDLRILAAIDASMRRMTARGARVALVTPAPPSDGDERSATPEDARRFARLNELLRAYAGARPDRVRIVDLAAIVCPGGPPCAEDVGGVRLRPRDGNHFGAAGAAWVSERLAPLVVRCWREPANPVCGEPDPA